MYDCCFIYCNRVAVWLAYQKNAAIPALKVCNEHYMAITSVTEAQYAREYGEPYNARSDDNDV